MNEKERLFKIVSRERVDRPAAICPGGMMSAAVTELLEGIPKNHFEDAGAMAEAARRVHSEAGFENLGVPFDMTVEAEEFGASVDMGDKTTEARVTSYCQTPIRDAVAKWRAGDIETLRSPAVMQAISELKNDSIPVIGNISGPISVATSVFDPIEIFKLIRKDPELTRDLLAAVSDRLKNLAREMVRAGADVIAMCDPTSTGEILGARNFREFSVPLYRELAHDIHAAGAAFILHICGRADNIIDVMDTCGADAISFDSMVSVAAAKGKTTTPLMGNVSTMLLASGKLEGIAAATRGAIDKGVAIAAPACGIGMETTVASMRALVDAAKGAAE